MQAILLSAEQSFVVSQSQEPVQVRDHAGNLLGRVVTGATSSRTLDTDHWVECWKEWYFETDEPETPAPLPSSPTRASGATQ